MKNHKFLFFIIIPAILLSSLSVSQAQLKDALQQQQKEIAMGYLQPFVDAFGNNLNAGFYRTAHVSQLGLHVYVGLVGMGTIIPDEDKTYMATPPQPFPQDPVETATVFGDNGGVVEANGVEYHFQNGVLQGDVVPFAIPQFEIGSVFGTMAKFRYFSGNIAGDQDESLGKIKLTGYGLQHSLSQYLFMFPIDLSAGFFYQKFEVSDIISTKAFSFGVQASKSFAIFTLYGAVSYSKAKMDVSYTYSDDGNEETVSFEAKSDTQLRLTLGGRLRLALFIINGDFTFGKQSTASLGVGLGL